MDCLVGIKSILEFTPRRIGEDGYRLRSLAFAVLWGHCGLGGMLQQHSQASIIDFASINILNGCEAKGHDLDFSAAK